jgi:hypothetical protein
MGKDVEGDIRNKLLYLNAPAGVFRVFEYRRC